MKMFTCDALTLVVEVVDLLASAIVETRRGVARDVLTLTVLAGVAGLTSTPGTHKHNHCDWVNNRMCHQTLRHDVVMSGAKWWVNLGSKAHSDLTTFEKKVKSDNWFSKYCKITIFNSVPTTTSKRVSFDSTIGIKKKLIIMKLFHYSSHFIFMLQPIEYNLFTQ